MFEKPESVSNYTWETPGEAGEFHSKFSVEVFQH
jgi:hypothetical protein